MSMTLVFYSLSLPSLLLSRLSEAAASLKIFIESKYVMMLGSNSQALRTTRFQYRDLKYMFQFSFDSREAKYRRRIFCQKHTCARRIRRGEKSSGRTSTNSGINDREYSCE